MSTPRTPRMATATPTRKVQAGGLAAAVTIILVWSLRQFAGVEVPTEVGMATQAVIAGLASYFVPPAAQDRVIS